MIKSITIKDINNTPIVYLPYIDFFKNINKIEFTENINIIIGGNGSGKSTLVDLISRYLFVKNVRSEFQWESRKNIYNIDGTFKDGVEVLYDYTQSAFRFINPLDDKDFDKTSDSVGITTLNRLQGIINYITNDNVKKDFPSFSDNKLKKFLEERTIENNTRRPTFICEEPDRNIDCNHIVELFHKIVSLNDKFQGIYVLHNPILIYELSKLPNVNVIETEEGYLENVVGYFKSLKEE